MPNKNYPWKKYKQSDAAKRQYMVYPKKKYYTLLETYRCANEMGKSEMLNFLIKKFFDDMPEQEKERIRSIAALNA